MNERGRTAEPPRGAESAESHERRRRESDERSESSLTRAIGLPHATAIVVGIIIGASVFVQASEITARVPSLAGVTLAWIVAGVLTMAGALVCAELSSAMPRTGGVYVFLREIYSPALGFLWGWAMFWSMHTGIAAAIATVFARYAAYFVPMSDAALRSTAVAAILMLSIINYLGVKFGSRVQTAFTVVKVVAVLAIIGAGLLLEPSAISAPSADVLSSASSPDYGGGDFLLAVGAGLFAFGGWHMVTYTAEETRNPERTIPRSLILGTIIVTACYVGLNFVYLSVLPIDRVIASTRVAADTFEALVGSWGGSFVAALVMFSAFGALNGVILAGPRVYYSMAQDGLLFKEAAEVHPTYRTPGRAIALQGIWAAVLVWTGTYRELVSRVIYTEWIFFALLALGVVAMRRRADYTPQWRMPGVPFVPVVFALFSFAIALNEIRTNPVNAAIGLFLVLIGLPVYWIWLRHSSPRAQSPQAGAGSVTPSPERLK
jgi:APA family basic amino acid/polyamine antiporter